MAGLFGHLLGGFLFHGSGGEYARAATTIECEPRALCFGLLRFFLWLHQTSTEAGEAAIAWLGLAVHLGVPMLYRNPRQHHLGLCLSATTTFFSAIRAGRTTPYVDGSNANTLWGMELVSVKAVRGRRQPRAGSLRRDKTGPTSRRVS